MTTYAWRDPIAGDREPEKIYIRLFALAGSKGFEEWFGCFESKRFVGNLQTIRSSGGILVEHVVPYIKICHSGQSLTTPINARCNDQQYA